MTSPLPQPRRTLTFQQRVDSCIQNYVDIVEEIFRAKDFTPEVKKPVRRVAQP